MVQVESSSLSDQGRSRSNNEDFVASFEPVDPNELLVSGCLYIVADGVGGESKGERASRYAAEKILYEYYRHPDLEIAQRLRQAMLQVNRDIFHFAEESAHFARMATTVVAAVVRKDMLIVANVGDSRAYLIRNGEANQISRDHSLVGEMVARGEVTEAAARDSRLRSRLTRSLGGEPEVVVDVYGPIPLQRKDRILLCSDGLTRYIDREKIGELTAQGSPQQVTERLIQYANGCGGADNVSTILIALQDAEAAEEPVSRFPSLPPPPSWEVASKEPRVGAAHQPPRTARGRRRWIAVGAGLTFLVVATGYGLLRPVLTPRIPTVASAAPGTAGVLSSSIPFRPAEIIQPSQTSAATVVPLRTAMPTPLPTGSSTPVPAIPTEMDQTTKANCSYQIKPGDVLSAVAERFGLGGNHYERIFCDPEATNSACDLAEPAHIQPGWIVIIPDVAIDVCIQNNGKVPIAAR